MNSIQIEAPEEVLTNGTTLIPGLSLHDHGTRKLENNRWLVPAYATNEAISTLESLGCVVTILMNNEELKQHQLRVFRQVEGNENYPGGEV
jgi:hypothetical protein